MTVVAAMGQMFYSLSLAMGILYTYGSYIGKDVDIEKSTTQVEIFDTGVALLAGLMIIPAVFAFSGGDMETLQAGPALTFITLPKVFASMGVGTIVGIAFFLIMNVFRVTTVDTLIEQGVSPSGAFRYYVLDVQNKSTGKKCVYVQPNTLDVDKGFIKLDTTIKKLVKQAPKPCEISCEWSGTKMIIDGEVYFDETDALAEQDGQLVYDIDDGTWSYTYFSIEYPIFNTIEEVKDKLGKLSDKLEEQKAEQTAQAESDTSASEDNNGTESQQSSDE